MVEAGAFKQCTSLTRIHIPASMVTHGYVGESPAYPGIFAADDGHLCERDRKDRQVQNSPSAQKAGPAAITPSPAAQVVITPPPQQPGSAYHHKYRRIQEPDQHNVPHPIPKHTDKSQQRSTHNNAELLPCPTGWEREGGRSGYGTLRSPSLALTALKMRPA